MTTSVSAATTDVMSTSVETAAAIAPVNEPVIQQVIYPKSTAVVTSAAPLMASTTQRVEDPFKTRTSFSLPSLTGNLGSLSSTATAAASSTTSDVKSSTFENWREKLKTKDDLNFPRTTEAEHLGSFEAGEGSRGGSSGLKVHGISPSTVTYERQNETGDSNVKTTGVSLGSRQRMVFEVARKRAQSNIEADRDNMAPPFASSDPFSRPKVQDVQRFSYEPSSPDVATAENIEYIRADLVRAGVPKKDLTFAMWDIARYCADAGSSESTEFIGTSSYGGRVTRMEIAAVIKKHTTLRRFCGFYAKIVWNIMLVTNIPPSGWMKRGYKENTKFAAFDFFVHVSNNAALEPENGLVRKPYHEELVAAQANKGVILHRTESAQDKNASTAHEVTGGRAGPRSRLTLKGKEMD
nr:coat protein [Asian prunus virus 3]